MVCKSKLKNDSDVGDVKLKMSPTHFVSDIDVTKMTKLLSQLFSYQAYMGVSSDQDEVSSDCSIPSFDSD